MALRRMGPPPSRPKPTLKPTHKPPADEVVTIHHVGPARNPNAGPKNNVVNRMPTKPQAAPQKTRRMVPDARRAEKGLSLRGLLSKQPRYITNSAFDIVIKEYKKRRTKGGMVAFVGTARDMNTKPMRLHKFKVIGLDPNSDRISEQKRIKVSCSCEFFCFYCEYALWTWGAANIEYSNGEPANVRNPGNHPLICKHLAKVLRTIYERRD